MLKRLILVLLIAASVAAAIAASRLSTPGIGSADLASSGRGGRPAARGLHDAGYPSGRRGGACLICGSDGGMGLFGAD